MSGRLLLPLVALLVLAGSASSSAAVGSVPAWKVLLNAAYNGHISGTYSCATVEQAIRHLPITLPVDPVEQIIRNYANGRCHGSAAPQLLSPTVPIAKGKLLKLPAVVAAALRRDHRSPDIYLIASRDGRNFYRVGDSGRCYGVAPAANLMHVSRFRDPAAALGGYGCFGTATPRTVIDRSTWGTSTANPAMHLRGLVGLASNAVHAIELVSPSGAVVGTVPVISNVFLTHRVPSDVTELRAVSARGTVIWQETH